MVRGSARRLLRVGVGLATVSAAVVATGPEPTPSRPAAGVAAALDPERLADDRVAVRLARDGLHAVVAFLDARPDLVPRESPPVPRLLGLQARDAVRRTWQRALDYVLALDAIGPAPLSGAAQDRASGELALLIRHAAFVAQYRFALELLDRFDRDPGLVPLLDEAVPELGLPPGTYARLRFRFLNVLRASEFAALGVLARQHAGAAAPELRAAIAEDRDAIWRMGRGRGPALTIKNAGRIVQDAARAAWVPVQAGIVPVAATRTLWRPGRGERPEVAPPHPAPSMTDTPRATQDSPRLTRVLILSASAGAGHVRAAQAIEQAFQQSGAIGEVRHVDVLQHTSALFRRIYSQAYLDLVNRAPEVLGWLYDYLDRPWKHERLRLAFEKLNARPFIKLLTAYRPDWIVCTHFLPAGIVAWLRDRERLDTPQAVVVTDFDVHAMWLVRHVERYFVALEETGVHLARLGIAEDRITVSGIPIDPVFAEPKDARAMRVKHGLAPDRMTILVSAGGFEVGPVERLVAALPDGGRSEPAPGVRCMLAAVGCRPRGGETPAILP